MQANTSYARRRAAPVGAVVGQSCQPSNSSLEHIVAKAPVDAKPQHKKGRLWKSLAALLLAGSIATAGYFSRYGKTEEQGLITKDSYQQKLINLLEDIRVIPPGMEISPQVCYALNKEGFKIQPGTKDHIAAKYKDWNPVAPPDNYVMVDTMTYAVANNIMEKHDGINRSWDEEISVPKKVLEKEKKYWQAPSGGKIKKMAMQIDSVMIILSEQVVLNYLNTMPTNKILVWEIPVYFVHNTKSLTEFTKAEIRVSGKTDAYIDPKEFAAIPKEFLPPDFKGGAYTAGGEIADICVKNGYTVIKASGSPAQPNKNDMLVTSVNR